LGGNSLSDLLVFGKLSGEGAYRYIQSENKNHEPNKEQVWAIIKNATDILNRESGKNPYLLHEDLQGVMQNNVGIVRTKELLDEGIKKITNLWKNYKEVKADGASQFNPGWHEALSLRSLLITSEAVARAAITREESRGAHTRVEFPEEDDEWLKYNLVLSKNEDGSMGVKKVLRDKPPPELNRIANLTIKELEAEVKKEQAHTE